MNNFSYQNTVRIEFGKDSIRKLSDLLKEYSSILLVYGGGSIKKNGVYDQVLESLADKNLVEYSGIQANPDYADCVKAIAAAREGKCDFVLGVGGGSVIDACKLIISGIPYDGDSWDIVTGKTSSQKALPLGCVLTLPATGTEMNGNSVISRRETGEKIPFFSPLSYPRFSIMDPETTFSLPPRQVANGIVDTFIHVMEQYMTYPVDALLQDRQAESILRTVIELAPLLRLNPKDYQVRANFMWCSTMALNGIISCGVPQDWSTHDIGHELTALYGLDHAQTLAIVLPGVLSRKRIQKKEKLLRYAEEIWGISCGDQNVKIDEAIARTALFFESSGVSTRFKDYGIDAEEAADKVSERFREQNKKVGEHQDLDYQEVREILLSRE